MLDLYDEIQVLGLIEGDLDDASAAALRKRLSADPRAATYVEQLVADRAALRAHGKIEVVLPADFMARIEQLLARPMLMPPATEVTAGTRAPLVMARPGEFRRQHRRKLRRIRWSRLSLAAALAAAMLAGLWAAVLGVNSMFGGGTERNQVAQPQAKPQFNPAPAANVLAADGTVHHHRPSLAVSDRQLLAGPGSFDLHSDNAPSAATVPAEFALIIQTDDVAATQKSLAHAVSSLQERGALVRNFSYQEAMRLEQQWRLAQGSRALEDEPLATASGDAKVNARKEAQKHRLAQHARKQLRAAATASGAASDSQTSGKLTGSAQLAASLEQQLEFSSAGADYTISVPAAQLHQLLEQIALQTHPASQTMLRMLSKDESPSAAAAPTSEQQAIIWITESPAIRAAMQRLASQAGADANVLLPVIVHEQPLRRSGSSR